MGLRLPGWVRMGLRVHGGWEKSRCYDEATARAYGAVLCLVGKTKVIRLWEQPLDSFLESPGLLPFAVLSQVRDRSQALRQVAERVDQLSDRQVQSNLTASAAILAG